mmetsp:Transcript_118733/g.383393  ORF Transcript_118733/g.383393 Transcript_118733/m.383393 type:complete len:352 (-) Transcript_118733:1716-2771(-)
MADSCVAQHLSPPGTNGFLSKRLVAQRAGCLCRGLEPMVQALVVELVLARRACLPWDRLGRQVYHVVADGAVLHALEKEREAARPHEHHSADTHGPGPGEHLPGLQHPVPKARLRDARHLLRLLGRRGPQREGVGQLHTELRTEVISPKLQHELLRPAGYRCLDVREPLALGLQLRSGGGRLRLHEQRGEAPRHEALDDVPVAPPRQGLPEAAHSTWQGLEGQEQHAGRQGEDAELHRRPLIAASGHGCCKHAAQLLLGASRAHQVLAREHVAEQLQEGVHDRGALADRRGCTGLPTLGSLQPGKLVGRKLQSCYKQLRWLRGRRGSLAAVHAPLLLLGADEQQLPSCQRC